MSLSADELERVDLGRMNLICAEAAAGSGDSELPRLLRKLDERAFAGSAAFLQAGARVQARGSQSGEIGIAAGCRESRKAKGRGEMKIELHEIPVREVAEGCVDSAESKFGEI